MRVLTLVVFAAACGGSNPPATQSADGPALLAAVRDNTFNFDEPAFYWLIEQARTQSPKIAATAPPLPWRFMLERPSEYRGRLAVIEGFVESSLQYEIVRNGRSYDNVIQTELSEGGTRGLCTVVSTNGAGPLPIGARVRGAGWFLKSRRFKTTAGEVSSAPLLVANHLEVMSSRDALTTQAAARRAARWPRDWLMVGIGVLAVVWLVLRRINARPRAGAADLRDMPM